MASRHLAAVLGAVSLGACYTPPDRPVTSGGGALERTEVAFQAVDAGTGGLLEDPEMTVRYLVREPIILDVARVEEVSTSDPYEISHEIGDSLLVVEVRLEADAYHRLDTVLSVRRGESAGPLTVRMSRRLDRIVETSAPEPAPEEVSVTTPTNLGRDAMRAGHRAFAAQAWLEATEAFQRMPEPEDEMSPYGREYLDAKVRQGVAHIHRSEFGRALEIFEEVTEMEAPGARAYLRLAQAQCAVGRVEEGRGTLAQVDRAKNRLDAMERSRIAALVAYRRGVCSYGEFDRAQTTRERVRTGAEAIRELNAFVEGARTMSPVPPEVFEAVQDAERRVADIRRRAGMGGGIRGGAASEAR